MTTPARRCPPGHTAAAGRPTRRCACYGVTRYRCLPATQAEGFVISPLRSGMILCLIGSRRKGSSWI